MRTALLLCLAVLPGLHAPAGAQRGRRPEPLRVHLRAGEKTHGPGQHDHPRFLADWSALLEERGCRVTGGMQFPGSEELAAADVLVMYAPDAGSIHGADRESLLAFLGRGGGIVVLHDAVCGDDPHWFKTLVGGAWEHGHSKWYEGEVGLIFGDREHPITRGAQNFDLVDEIYWDLHLSEDARVLASSFHTPFDVTPQMWVVEQDDYRAFVSIQGHEHASFSHPAWRTLLLRGIAWAGKRDADLLTTPAEVASLRYPPGGPTRPEDADRTFALEGGFEATLVAAEPLVRNPISIDWDARGRMWVACTPGYPDKEEFSGVPAHDEVAILEDTDGDGRLDTRRVFYRGLDLVTSLVHHRDGVIVAQAPEILFLRDTDGDDFADTVETLFSGFGYSDTHAVISNLRWGLDGWIYGTQGYSGNGSRNVIAHGGIEPVDCGHVGNGVFRFRPDGSWIETVSSYGSNTWGLDFTWDGELFFTMANGSHLRHVVLPEPVLARGRVGNTPSWKHIADHAKALPISVHERAPYVQIDFVGGFTAAAGCMIYGGGAWPEEYEGDHFVCEPTLNLVHRDDLSVDGYSFRGSRTSDAEFLAAEDLWFRPVHLRTGPDGALYVLDFYNQAAVHNDTRGPQHGPTNAAVRPDRDHVHGRIWRVQSARTRALPAWSFDSQAGRVSALTHPNDWVRRTAQRLLVEQRWPLDEGGALARLAIDAGAPPHARVHALWVLHEWSGVPEDVLVAALADPSPGVRKSAARLAGLGTVGRMLSVHPAGMGDAVAVALPSLLDDADARVRLEAAVALSSQARNPEARAAIVRAYGRDADPWFRSGLLGTASVWPAQYADAALAAREGELLVELAARAGRTPDHAAELVRRLAAAEEAESELLAAALRALAADLASERPAWTPELRQTLAALARNADVRVAMAAAPIVARWDADGELAGETGALAGRLLATLGDEGASWEQCLAALEALLGMPAQRGEAIAAAAWMLEPYHLLEHQERAILLFGRTDHPAAGGALAAAFPRLSSAAREAAFQELLKRPAWALLLLDQVVAGELRSNDLGPRRAFRLKTYPDEAVAARARAVLTASSSDRQGLIASFAPVVAEPGDPARGKELFDQNCVQCHVLNGAGREVGPALDGMGAHGAAELLPFVLDPNATVEDSYLEYALRTLDGQVFSGVVVQDGADQVVLRNAEGDAAVRREDIDELWSTGRTPMPEGFEELGADGLRDLFAYLCAGFADWRVIPLGAVATVSTTLGLYDRREPVTYEFVKRGVVDVEGVPFEILDPARTVSGGDAIVLKGGMARDWDSWTRRPASVEIPVGFALSEVHVLGGVSAWGFPFTDRREPACTWTWLYTDGRAEEVVLRDGEQFADWIRPHEVPGSQLVSGVLEPGSRGQLRRFSLSPSRTDVAVEAIALESPRNYQAPTFLALTARVVGAPAPAPRPRAAADVVLVGGGSSHDFERWFRGTDVETLTGAELGPVAYTDAPAELPARAQEARLLVLANNQPLPAEARAAVFAHVRGGGGLLVVHAATWFNWADWPEYNAELVGGGARSHEPLREFEVRVVAPEHPLAEGLPGSFRIRDELYRFEPADGSAPEVVAVGRSLETGDEFPVLFALPRAGNVAITTLGHDGGAHEHDAYRRLLVNAARWCAR